MECVVPLSLTAFGLRGFTLPLFVCWLCFVNAGQKSMDQIAAVFYNNVGAERLREENLDDAHACFKQALAVILGTVAVIPPEEEVGQLENPATSSTTPTDQSCNDVAEFAAATQLAAAAMCSASCSTQLAAASAGPLLVPTPDLSYRYYVRPDAIHLMERPLSYSTDALIDAHVISAIVVYNLALVTHLQGAQADNHYTEGKLRRALNLYGRAKSLLHHAGVGMASATGDLVVDVLSCSILNNMGHIFFELGDYATSRACYDALVNMVHTIQAHQNSDAETIERLDCYKSFFLMNAVVLRDPPQLAKAA